LTQVTGTTGTGFPLVVTDTSNVREGDLFVMDGIADSIFLDVKVVEAFSGKGGSPVNTAMVFIVDWGGSKDIREMQILHEKAEMMDLLGIIVRGNTFSLTGTPT
jgi:hypothetical protein